MTKNIYKIRLAVFAAILFTGCETPHGTIYVESIILNQTALTLTVGEQVTLTASVHPTNTIKQNLLWRSNNTLIATVDENGRVTVVAPGRTHITVQDEFTGAKAKCIITVKQENIILNSGETYTFDRIAPTGGCSGKVTYLWQQSNDGQTWTDAPGMNSERSYTTQPVIVNTYFRRLATDNCGVTLSAETVKTTIPVWATSNVAAPGTFAANPQDAGMFYQWNRRIGWAATGDATGWNNRGVIGTTWEIINDPCPAGWRVPVYAELEALTRLSSQWVTNWNDTGVNGYLFDTVPNQIFLPAAGLRINTDGELRGAGFRGHYWGSKQNIPGNAESLYFNSDESSSSNSDFAFGFSVRCVAE